MRLHYLFGYWTTWKSDGDPGNRDHRDDVNPRDGGWTKGGGGRRHVCRVASTSPDDDVISKFAHYYATWSLSRRWCAPNHVEFDQYKQNASKFDSSDQVGSHYGDLIRRRSPRPGEEV